MVVILDLGTFRDESKFLTKTCVTHKADLSIKKTQLALELAIKFSKLLAAARKL